MGKNFAWPRGQGMRKRQHLTGIFGVKKHMTSRFGSMALALGLTSALLAVPFAYAESGGGGDSPYWKKKRARAETSSTSSVPARLIPHLNALGAAVPQTNFATNNAGKATTKTEVVAERGLQPMVSSSSDRALADAISRYEIIASRGGWGSVGPKKLSNGSSGPQVVALKRRLVAEGYLNADSLEGDEYSDAVTKAVARFQANHGLAVTGKVDSGTINAMNVPVAQRLATLRANQPRMAEYAKGLEARYVIVNVPALQLETVEFDRVFSIHNVVAGKPERATPVTLTKVSDINFNPFWNAPVSIVDRDILPRLRREGNKVLRDMNMRIYDGYDGPEVDPRTVDWDRTTADRYFFRQDPGENNSMATVKINFPSPFGIYLHDTPSKYLFTTANRFVSSGCVRVEQIPILVNWILNGQDGWNPARIQNMAETRERLDVKVTNGPQIRVVYLTAWAMANGDVNFRPDIYEMDGTGFVVGQPLAPGELADGQRFVLKERPHPVNAAAVEDDPFDLYQPDVPRRVGAKSVYQTDAPRRAGVKNTLWNAASPKKTVDVDEPAPITNFKSGLAPKKKPAAGIVLQSKQAAAARPSLKGKKAAAQSKTKKKLIPDTQAAEPNLVTKKKVAAAAEPVKKKKKIVQQASSPPANISPSSEPTFGQ